MAKKIYSYCDCIPKGKKVTTRGSQPYRLVYSNRDGTCSECGYYVVKSTKKVVPTELLKHVTRDVQIDDIEVKNYKGGLSLKSQNQSKRYHQRKLKKRSGSSID